MNLDLLTFGILWVKDLQSKKYIFAHSGAPRIRQASGGLISVMVLELKKY